MGHRHPSPSPPPTLTNQILSILSIFPHNLSQIHTPPPPPPPPLYATPHLLLFNNKPHMGHRNPSPSPPPTLTNQILSILSIFHTIYPKYILLHPPFMPPPTSFYLIINHTWGISIHPPPLPPTLTNQILSILSIFHTVYPKYILLHPPFMPPHHLLLFNNKPHMGHRHPSPSPPPTLTNQILSILSIFHTIYPKYILLQPPPPPHKLNIQKLHFILIYKNCKFI